jgi:signal transduction histidine kinase
VVELIDGHTVDVVRPVLTSRRGATSPGGTLARVPGGDPQWRKLYLGTVGLDLMLAVSQSYSTSSWLAFIALTLLAQTAIVFVRSHPLTVLAWEILVVLVAACFDLYPYAGVMVALYFFCVERKLVPAIVATAGVVCAFDAIQFYQGSGQVAFFKTMITLAVFPVGTLMAARQVRTQVVARYAEERRVLESELALREERLHLARETHDVLTHSVSVISLQAEGALNLFDTDSGAVRRALDDIRQVASRSTGELRSVVHRMQGRNTRGAVVECRGVRDIPELVEFVRRSGRTVELQVDEPVWMLTPEQSHVVYRTVQEGLTNAVKHGAPNRGIQVRLRWTSTLCRVEVENHTAPQETGPSGPGESGHGLRGIRERVTAVGGRFETNEARQRFLLRATFVVADGQGKH